MFKKFFKKVVVTVLTFEARLVLRKYKPKIVGITGSVGKTSTKEAVALVLGLKYVVRKSEKSYNNEFGVPLTVLGLSSARRNLWGWLKNIVNGLLLVVFDNDYPQCLVLEIAADRPGDIKRIVKWVKFDVAIMTRLPDVPAHIEFFKKKELLIEEKVALIKAVNSDGLVVLNGDDEDLLQFKSELRARALTYGQNKTNDIVAAHSNILYTEGGGDRLPEGLTFKAEYDSKSFPVRVSGILGRHQIYPILAGIAIGVAEGINMITIIEKLADYQVPPGRMRIIAGVDNSLLLDDTYNSSPVAVASALETLGVLENVKRKICVLGDMLELGPHTSEEHKKIGVLAGKVCDLIITTGVRTRFIDESALAGGFPADKIFHCDDSVSAGKKLRELIKAGDIVLLKGSQSTRMERAVEAVMAKPEEKRKMLVRQEGEWKSLN